MNGSKSRDGESALLYSANEMGSNSGTDWEDGNSTKERASLKNTPRT